jgi:predicted GIY-YIG superfamily endonuclease
MSYCVYKHTFPNGKVYIGITGQSPEKRWRHGFGYTHNSHLKYAIAKYGWENVKHEILFDGLTKEDACRREIELIAEHKSNQREFGYNMSTGGEQGTRGVRGAAVWNKGKSGCYSQEARERISAGLRMHYQTHSNTSATKFVKGQTAWNKGQTTSAETRAKQSLAKKNIVGEKNHNSKPVLQYTLSGEFVKRYVSATEASAALALKSRNSVLNCCKGKAKTAGGYMWKFERTD